MPYPEDSSKPTLRLGIDLGGTKIEIVALDDSGHELLRRRVATPQGDYRGTVAAVAGLVKDAESALAARGQVGLGIPGAESAAGGLIKNANSTCLIGKALRRDLQTLLQREIRLANDANCFALSEAIDGAGQDAAIVFGSFWEPGSVAASSYVGRYSLAPITLPENGGTTLALPGRGNATASGLLLRPPGCVESWLSGPALAADHARHTGQKLLPQHIAERAEGGDAACAATLERYERRLAKALAQVINIVDPEVIVLAASLQHATAVHQRTGAVGPLHLFRSGTVTDAAAP